MQMIFGSARPSVKKEIMQMINLGFLRGIIKPTFFLVRPQSKRSMIASLTDGLLRVCLLQKMT